jgi:ATP-dependent Lhr-like helicase
MMWGRYVLPLINQRRQNQPLQKKRNAGPVKSTPISLVARSNLDIWQALAKAQLGEGEVAAPGASAARIASDLEQHGASFFDQVQSRTGLLKTQLEEGLAELVSLGRVCSDSFTGLRALLTPNHKKPTTHKRRGRKAMFGVEDAGRWSLLDTFEQETGQQKPSRWNALDEEQLERLALLYLQRWGVVFRALIDRETLSPPWRILLVTLRKMELRGNVRGGRFVAGVGGEQFAFQETVNSLRKFKRSREAAAMAPFYCLSATDPANLINLTMPTRKLPRLASNRVLYRGGVPIAVMESGETHFLREVSADQQWQFQQMLTKRVFPPRLRSYLGTR